MLAVVRVLGRGLAQTAEAMRTTVLRARPRARRQRGRARAPLRRARSAGFMPMIGPMLEQMVRLHLRHVGAHRGDQRRRARGGHAAGRARGHRRLRRPRRLHAPGRGGRARRARPRRRAPRRPSPCERLRAAGAPRQDDRRRGAARRARCRRTMLELALELIDAADAEGEDFPQLRVGVAAGAALSRAGDWYGRPVNLASRVTAIARPGSVLATREVRDAVRRRLPLVVGRSALAARASTGRCASTARGAWSATRTPKPRLALASPLDALRSTRDRGARSRAGGPDAGGRGRRPARARRAGARDGSGPRATRAPPARPTALIPISVVCSPSRSAIGPRIAMPERHEAERHGEVVGAHARHRVRAGPAPGCSGPRA